MMYIYISIRSISVPFCDILCLRLESGWHDMAYVSSQFRPYIENTPDITIESDDPATNHKN